MALVGLHVVTSNGKYTLLSVANLHNTLRFVVDGKQKGGNGSDGSEFFKAQGSRKKYLRFKRKLRHDTLYIEHFEARSRYDSVE